MADRQMAKRKNTAANTREKRMHVSFITRKGCVDGSRRSPGLRVRMQALVTAMASGDYKRPSQVAPVTVCIVLAYSCAAARDLHPLPIAPASNRRYDHART